MTDPLRPAEFADFIGQETAKTMLVNAMASAVERQELLDHVLLIGPPGLGKTTLAFIVANQLGVSAKITSGPSMDRDAAYQFLTDLEPGGILFVDEIHRLQPAVAEVLYPAQEMFAIDLPGLSRIPINPFTLIGATTDPGRLPAPFRDRFGLHIALDFYDHGELTEIVRRSARIMDLDATDEACAEIAKRCKDTPRVANRLLARTRDYAAANEWTGIGVDTVREALDSIGVDRSGLDQTDRKYLSALVQRFSGGPVGLKTLARAIAEEITTLESMIEPYLIRSGRIIITNRGRSAV